MKKKSIYIFNKKPQQVICLILLSSILQSCIGDKTLGFANSAANSAAYIGDTHPNIEQEKPDKDKIKDKEKHKKELYDKLKNHGNTNIDQKKEIDKILSKLPLYLLDIHNTENGSIEFISDNWQTALQERGINPQENYTDYNDSIYDVGNKKIGTHSLAHAYQDAAGNFKLLVRADTNINYSNNGENRKRLYYAATKGLLSLHTMDINGETLINELKAAQDTPGNRYLSHPSIIELLEYATHNPIIDKENEHYQKLLTESIAYLLANHAEDPEMMNNFLPELTEKLEQIEHNYLHNENMENNIEQLEAEEIGRGSRDLGWFSNTGGCTRANGAACSFKHFSSSKSDVMGFEWEARNAEVGSLNRTDVNGNSYDILTMDTILAKSQNVDGLDIPVIKLVIEESNKYKYDKFIEIVTGPLPTQEVAGKAFFAAINSIVDALTEEKNTTLQGLINSYNTKLFNARLPMSVYNKYKLTLATADNEHLNKDKVTDKEFGNITINTHKNLDMNGKDQGKHFFQQTNVMLNVNKVFQDKKFAKEYLFGLGDKKNGVVKASKGYKAYEAAQKITNSIVQNNTLSNEGKAFLTHILYNLFYSFSYSSKQKPSAQFLNTNSGKYFEQDVLFRHSPEDMLYSVLSEKDIDFLNTFQSSEDLLPINSKLSIKKQIYEVFTNTWGSSQLEQLIFPNGINKHENMDPGDIYKDKTGQWKQIITPGIDTKDQVLTLQINERDLNNYIKNGIIDFKLGQSLFGDNYKSPQDLLLEINFSSILRDGVDYRIKNKKQVIPINHQQAIEDGGGFKFYSFDLPNGETHEKNYKMPRDWGHEQLFTVEGKTSDEYYTVAEIRKANGLNYYNLTDILNNDDNSIKTFDIERLKNFYPKHEK